MILTVCRRKKGDRVISFFNALITYALEAVVLAAVAIGGIFFGKFLRKKKNEKEAGGRKDSE